MTFMQKQASSPCWMEGLVAFVVQGDNEQFLSHLSENKSFIRAVQALKAGSVNDRDKRHDEDQILGHLLASPKDFKPLLQAYQQASRQSGNSGLSLFWHPLLQRLLQWMTGSSDSGLLDPETDLPRLLSVIARPDAVRVAQRQLQNQIASIQEANKVQLIRPGDGTGRAVSASKQSLADKQRYYQELASYLVSSAKSNVQHPALEDDLARDRSLWQASSKDITVPEIASAEALLQSLSEDSASSDWLASLENEAATLIPQSDSDWTPERLQSLQANLQQRKKGYERNDIDA